MYILSQFDSYYSTIELGVVWKSDESELLVTDKKRFSKNPKVPFQISGVKIYSIENSIKIEINRNELV